MKRRHAILGMLLAGMMIPASAQDTTTFHGFLFSKLQSIGTRSEGPGYFLQTFDGREIPIIKHASPWQPDPELQRYVGIKVTIEGELLGEAITYRVIKPYEPSLSDFKP